MGPSRGLDECDEQTISHPLFEGRSPSSPARSGSLSRPPKFVHLICNFCVYTYILRTAVQCAVSSGGLVSTRDVLMRRLIFLLQRRLLHAMLQTFDKYSFVHCAV